MATRLDMRELSRGVVEKLTSLMRLKRAGILFFRNRQECCCHEAEGFDGKDWAAFCIDHERDLVESFSTFKGEFRVEYLPALLKAGFQEQHLEFVVPIRSKDKLLGAILVGEKLSESPFHQEDLDFLSSAARQASVAIENAFLHEELTEQERLRHELEIARRIQMASLPQSTPSVPGLEIAGISIPAMEVGGDYFDYLNGDPHRFTVIVGDVSGKGTSAALYMSKVQGILRSLHGFGLSPHELFVRTNHLLCQDMEKKSFVTAMGAFFTPDVRRLVLARAGHLPLFHYRKSNGAIDRVTPRGLGLGLNAEGKFAAELEERAMGYERGDLFLLVTDGVTEARRSDGEQFGEERMEEVLRSGAGASAGDVRDRLIAAVAAFAGEAPQHDDQTVVVVKAV
jgi:serine phosphatase RsbU (regulator of sigma subunit)